MVSLTRKIYTALGILVQYLIGTIDLIQNLKPNIKGERSPASTLERRKVL